MSKNIIYVMAAEDYDRGCTLTGGKIYRAVVTKRGNAYVRCDDANCPFCVGTTDGYNWGSEIRVRFKSANDGNLLNELEECIG